MEKDKGPSTPSPPEDILVVDEGESATSKDEIIARLKKIIAEQGNTIADQVNTIADQVNTIAENDKTIAEQKKNVAQTKFLEFLHLVNERVYDKFTIETDRSQLALGTTSVAGKFCPRHLRRWASFGALHDQKFQELEDRLNPVDACFSSPHDVSGFLSAFSPKAKNEATLRPFLRIALEKPAATVVNEYLHAASESPDTKSRDYVHFTDQDKTTQTSRSSKNILASSTGGASNPDRICVYDHNKETKVKVPFIVGEYKAAHRLTGPKLEHMLDSPPEDYLTKATRIDVAVSPNDAPNDAVFSNKYPSVYTFISSFHRATIHNQSNIQPHPVAALACDHG
ncbi:hypothetical protein SPBR_03036 [Sporothrix brasiliensis 5110]|uniref:Uncharacterized protein n=1 Tax=Sporothrix brasiliensis 5110 TaxID=1398154 RepID=A0A0C2J0B0_9PEZI|nr:uncharacterized protein SPBR_03036 [Sporothrix brasiliensis 5110]KIH92435.1 hypothetical protein SPBR_03036 [Sporothrix brasiliensis 5110]